MEGTRDLVVRNLVNTINPYAGITYEKHRFVEKYEGIYTYLFLV